MSATEVPARGRTRLGIVEGDLVVGRGAEITADGPAGVDVQGIARFLGDARIVGDFRCRGIRAEKGRIEATAALRVDGDVDAPRGEIDVAGPFAAGDVEVGRRLALRMGGEARDVDVGGELETLKDLRAGRVSVGGQLRATGTLTASRAEVGGRLEAARIVLDGLDVGGQANVREGEVRGDIRVGGFFDASGPLTFGALIVGGRAGVGAGSRGGRVEVGGRFEGAGDLEFQRITVGGAGSIHGAGRGDRVEAGGAFEVTGALSLTGELEVGGVVEIGGRLDAKRVSVGGRLRAERARITERAEVGGEIVTVGGFRAREVRIGRGGHVRGPLVGGIVEIGRRAEVESVFGDEIRVGAKARTGALAARRIEIDGGASAEEAVYTESIRTAADTRFDRPPRQVETLPPFPE